MRCKLSTLQGDVSGWGSCRDSSHKLRASPPSPLQRRHIHAFSPLPAAGRARCPPSAAAPAPAHAVTRAHCGPASAPASTRPKLRRSVTARMMVGQQCCWLQHSRTGESCGDAVQVLPTVQERERAHADFGSRRKNSGNRRHGCSMHQHSTSHARVGLERMQKQKNTCTQLTHAHITAPSEAASTSRVASVSSTLSLSFSAAAAVCLDSDSAAAAAAASDAAAAFISRTRNLSFSAAAAFALVSASADAVAAVSEAAFACCCS